MEGRIVLLNEVARIVRRNSSFALVTHVQPDADALGSMLALAMALEQMGKSVICCSQGSERLSYLPGYVRLGLGGQSVAWDALSVDVIIVLDCANQERAEVALPVSDMTKPVSTPFVTNIDHHISNNGYGDLAWIDAESSSVGEMLWMLLAELGIEVNDHMAANLYASIVNDTGQFAFHNTTQRTHVIAGELRRYHFAANDLHNKLFYERSFVQTKLLARALASLWLSHEGKVAVMQLTYRDFTEMGASDDCEGFINQAMHINGVLTAMFVKEVEPQLCRVSFRSRGHIDVNLLAGQFNGGGHVRASGCTLNMSLERALPVLLKELDSRASDLKLEE